MLPIVIWLPVAPGAVSLYTVVDIFDRQSRLVDAHMAPRSYLNVGELML